MTPEGLCINDKQFKWGMTLNEIVSIFDSKSTSVEKSDWLNHEIPCPEIIGLKSLTSNLRGPSSAKPIMQVSFDLATIKPRFFEKPHSKYLKHLTRLLGKPHSFSKNNLQNKKKVPSRAHKLSGNI